MPKGGGFPLITGGDDRWGLSCLYRGGPVHAQTGVGECLNAYGTLLQKENNGMAHSLIEIKDQALQLSPEDRARLAVQLLASLEESSESAEEIEKLWIAEAEGRFQELQEGVVQGISASEVFSELRSKR